MSCPNRDICYAAWENGWGTVLSRSGSRIRISCGNGYPAADSVETFRGIGPLAWSDRGRPNRTNTVCSNPGWPCQLRYAGVARLPTASSDPGGHANAPDRFASVPATTHGLSLPTGPPCRARLDLVRIVRKNPGIFLDFSLRGFIVFKICQLFFGGVLFLLKNHHKSVQKFSPAALKNIEKNTVLPFKMPKIFACGACKSGSGVLLFSKFSPPPGGVLKFLKSRFPRVGPGY